YALRPLRQLRVASERVSRSGRRRPPPSGLEFSRESLKFLRTQPILRQVAVAAIVLMLLVAVAVVWSGNQARLERTVEVTAEADRIATTATALLDEYFGSLDAMATLLVRHPAVKALDGM